MILDRRVITGFDKLPVTLKRVLALGAITLCLAGLVSGCTSTQTRGKGGNASTALAAFAPAAPASEMDQLILKYADEYQVPEQLIRRVIVRESNYNPGARNGPYWGLMQIRHDTARGMGYAGSANGLLDAETNLRYAVKYLRGAYLTADGNEDQAVKFYARGYYYDAKRKGLLEEAGLR